MFIDDNQDVQDQNSEGAAAEGAAEDAKDTKGADDSAGKGTTPTLETLQAELQRSQSERDAAVMRLLDPEFQQFIHEKRSGKAAAKAEPKDPFANLDDEKLNTMTNRQLIETAVSIISGKLQEEFLPAIEEKLEGVTDTLEDQRAKREVAEAAGKYKDFWDFKPAMVQLSNQARYSNLGAEDLYILAKSRTGASGAAPAKTESAAAKASARAVSEKPNAGGSGKQAADKELSKEEAGDAAWEKVFGKKS